MATTVDTPGALAPATPDYKVVVDRVKAIRGGSILVDFTIKVDTGAKDDNGAAIYTGIVSGQTEVPAGLTATARRSALLAAARQIAPDGVTL